MPGGITNLAGTHDTLCVLQDPKAEGDAVVSMTNFTRVRESNSRLLELLDALVTVLPITAAVLALTAAATTGSGSGKLVRLVPLTCPELVWLLRAFVLTPSVRDTEHVHWMAWSRHHQAVAQACHQHRHAFQDQPWPELQLP